VKICCIFPISFIRFHCFHALSDNGNMSVSTVLRRKVTLRVYANPKQDAVLSSHLEWHRLLSNAALQERIDAYQKKGISISYISQQNVLSALKREMPELAELGSQALQETLRRVDRSFQAFFRRCAAGQTPGFPRFKSFNRFNSFCYPSPAGWSFIPLEAKPGIKNARSGILRVGDLRLKVRGMSRFESFEPNDLTLKRVRKSVVGKSGKTISPAVWEASITLRLAPQDCQRQRTGNEIRSFDQGLTDRLVFDDGTTVENTRLLRIKLELLADLQRQKARCKKNSRRYKALSRQIAQLHRHIANQRKDELHKITTDMAMTCELLATEELVLNNMTRAPVPKPELDANGVKTGQFLPNGAAAKAGLNRELLSSGMGFFLQLLSYKVEETGTRWHVAETKKLKPTQRCACCGSVEKKQLKDRVHHCEHCGFKTSRDRNAALVCLTDALMPGFYEARQKKKFFCDNGQGSFVRNRIAYAHQGSVELDILDSEESAAGTVVVTGSSPETPTTALA
jgi:putative transposase